MSVRRTFTLLTASCLICITQANAAFYSGWAKAGIELPSSGQPWNAEGYVTNHTSVGKILYTGDSWSSTAPHVIRNNAEYFSYSEISRLTSSPFKGMEYYTFAGPTVYNGTAHKYIDFTLQMPGSSQKFSFGLKLNDYNNSIKLSVIDSIADPVIKIGNNEYQMQMLGFSKDNGNTISSSTCTSNNRTNSGDIYFQMKKVVPTPPIPTPATASITLGLMGLAALKRRR
ncbi:hypothetical protein KS4_35770 [Poriferisphaera corsica]|uniref:PEP-CTERM sorting domain-containing protein n=1 Tax=Poriferisphaera corsica TaxID=2528020 RepID=A0A517YZ42_9BACT|nr:hypothetical protein [Poriferisphaera corsica]QDU35494.1 hypothetical protein KS4_35770 [Poriferisphaera corsica]